MSGLIGLGGYGSDSDSDSASGSPGSRTRASSSGEMEVDGKDVITVGDGDASMDEEEIVNADAAAEFSSELRRMSRYFNQILRRNSHRFLVLGFL